MQTSHNGIADQRNQIKASLTAWQEVEVDLSTIDGSPLDHLSKLREFSSETKQTKDGLPQKRRGPKPDSKPALTRRQELNRQAQRTHRERKEMYIKTLEQEVLRLKELYILSAKERDVIAEENRRLKALLASHGISYDFATSPVQFKHESLSMQPSSSGSISGSYAPTLDNTSQSSPSSGTTNLGQHEKALSPLLYPAAAQMSMAQSPSTKLDYDQAGIDFVLTYDSLGRPMRMSPLSSPPPLPPPPHPPSLERPCMDHMQFLLVRSLNPDGQVELISGAPVDDAEHAHMAGHALMSTAPLHSHIMERPAENHPYQMPELAKSDLVKLLHLSSRLPIDREGEITPIMAWTLILTHPKLAELDENDFETLKTALSPKVTCYGFGAVIEEFEVRDALHAVLQSRSGQPLSLPMFAADEVPVYA